MSRLPSGRVGTIVLALGLLVGTGCSLLRPFIGPPRLADCPGPVVPTGSLPAGDYAIQEQVHVVGGKVDAAFRVVAEKRGERLVLVGFDPLGAKVFSVIQEGTEVRSDSDIGLALQVPPENLLRDLHAADFANPDAPARTRVARPGCGYTTTLVRVSRRALP